MQRKGYSSINRFNTNLLFISDCRRRSPLVVYRQMRSIHSGWRGLDILGANGTEKTLERWALIRQLPTTLRTALEDPTPQLTMNELLNKADDLFATPARDTVASVDTNISAAVFAGTRVKRRVVSNESDKHNAVKSKQLCWLRAWPSG